jgi:hypothetical protein
LFKPASKQCAMRVQGQRDLDTVANSVLAKFADAIPEDQDEEDQDE